VQCTYGVLNWLQEQAFCECFIFCDYPPTYKYLVKAQPCPDSFVATLQAHIPFLLHSPPRRSFHLPTPHHTLINTSHLHLHHHHAQTCRISKEATRSSSKEDTTRSNSSRATHHKAMHHKDNKATTTATLPCKPNPCPNKSS